MQLMSRGGHLVRRRHGYMNNLPVRKSTSPGAPVSMTWDPLRQIRNVFGWDPFAEMAPFTLEPAPLTFTPAFEVKETAEAFIFRADVPGLKETDLEINLVGDRLTISGKRENERREGNETYYTYERSFGNFQRTFTLPTGVNGDATKAELNAGVLTVTLPKLPEAQAKHILVKAERPDVRAKS
jgi:HSP20 family protein